MITKLVCAFAVGVLLSPGQSNSPVPSGPVRNTFVVATETVIDSASAVDIKAEDARFNAQMLQLKQARETLAGMVNDDREREIASAANELVFMVSACHIQAKGGASTSGCEAQFARAKARMMESIGKHKDGAAWVDGLPT